MAPILEVQDIHVSYSSPFNARSYCVGHRLAETNFKELP